MGEHPPEKALNVEIEEGVSPEVHSPEVHSEGGEVHLI